MILSSFFFNLTQLPRWHCGCPLHPIIAFAKIAFQLFQRSLWYVILSIYVPAADKSVIEEASILGYHWALYGVFATLGIWVSTAPKSRRRIQPVKLNQSILSVEILSLRRSSALFPHSHSSFTSTSGNPGQTSRLLSMYRTPRSLRPGFAPWGEYKSLSFKRCLSIIPITTSRFRRHGSVFT